MEQSHQKPSPLFNIMHNIIKEKRIEAELTQEELAKKVGVRRETIVLLEQGKYNPSLQLAMNISRVFNITIEELFPPLL
jgi:putative transcriptional regulator